MIAQRRIQELFARFGLELRRKKSADALLFEQLVAAHHLPEQFSDDNLTNAFLKFVVAKRDQAQGQLFQDLFVLFMLKEKRQGFFVEFGATNGKHINNSYLLEKNYAWQGILAEPARVWHEALHQNRSCNIDTRCVWRKSGEELMFNEVVSDPELSTINQFSTVDHQAALRQDKNLYAVATITLLDLLQHYHAPKQIDYLSIDTEGTEYEILKAFDFKAYDIQLITVEHNGTADQERIHTLLTANGFERVMAHITRWDDWYVKKGLR